MGFINDIKKVFFGVSSVSKSAGEKMAETAGEYLDKAGKATEELGEKITKSTAESLEKAKGLTEEVGGEVMKRAEDLWERTKAVAEDVGGRVIETTQQFTERAKTASEGIFSTEQETASTPEAQATQETQKQSSMYENIMKKAEELTEKLKQQVGDDVPKATTIGYDNAKGSLLDDKDDFFERAKRFADGDYHNSGKNEKTKNVEVTKDPNYQKPTSEGKAKGFEDMDGDGNELIDDAIIVE